VLRIITYPAYLELKTIPPPVNIQSETTQNFGNILVYHSSTPVWELLEYYREELPKWGWEYKIDKDDNRWCIIAKREGIFKVVSAYEEGVFTRVAVTGLHILPCESAIP
jgi:hypothetical protein